MTRITDLFELGSFDLILKCKHSEGNSFIINT